jgi:hypothetical protein
MSERRIYGYRVEATGAAWMLRVYEVIVITRGDGTEIYYSAEEGRAAPELGDLNFSVTAKAAWERTETAVAQQLQTTVTLAAGLRTQLTQVQTCKIGAVSHERQRTGVDGDCPRL